MRGNSKKTIKNPLRKRYIRDLRADMGRYIVIFALLVISIGFVSGYLVAADSMILAYDESYVKYNIEDGHFTVQNKLNRAQTKAVESYETLMTAPRTDLGDRISNAFRNVPEILSDMGLANTEENMRAVRILLTAKAATVNISSTSP